MFKYIRYLMHSKIPLKMHLTYFVTVKWIKFAARFVQFCQAHSWAGHPHAKWVRATIPPEEDIWFPGMDTWEMDESDFRCEHLENLISGEYFSWSETQVPDPPANILN